MDYGSLRELAYRLVRLFWWEILQINPDQTDLRVAPQTATRWSERFAVTTGGRPRGELHSTLFAIRGLYRDLAEWSHHDPVRWGIWVFREVAALEEGLTHLRRRRAEAEAGRTPSAAEVSWMQSRQLTGVISADDHRPFAPAEPPSPAGPLPFVAELPGDWAV